MATPKLSNILAQQAVDAVAQFGTCRAAGEALGLPAETTRKRREAGLARGFTPSGNKVSTGDESAQRTIAKLEQELRVARKESDELEAIKKVIGAMSRSVADLDPPRWVVQPAGRTSSPGVPTLMLSDWHGGEHVSPTQVNGVNEYSVAIMRERATTLIDSAVHLLEIISPKMDYPGIVLPLAGDMVSGNIHDELTATNEINSMPAVLELFEILSGVIERLRDVLSRVFLPCVGGNHGRDTPKIWNKDRHATSFDWLLYQFLAKRFAGDKRVTFFIPDSTGAYYKVYDHAYWLVHGDSFRGGDGMIGCLGPIIRGDHKMRSRNAQIDQSYDTMLLGHFHQYLHHGRVIVNGSLKGYDEYAFNNGFGFEQPQQALWLTHPKYGITYRMPVYVDRKREPIKTSWVALAA